MALLTHVSFDDWAGLYKDWKLFTEGHCITIYDLVQAAGGQPCIISEKPVNEEFAYPWIEEQGRLPEWFQDIPKEVFHDPA